jgi:tRNA-uridine 2-sulfurtransferase
MQETMENVKYKIAVGMSGGVDSTMAATLLKEAGHEVVGLTMRIWQGAGKKAGSLRGGCYGPGEEEEIAAAQAACRKMGIAHHTIDLVREYEQAVLQNFSSEYLAGRTPNPCVLCNHFIKFGALLEHARASGIHFDYFATGHYARIEKDEQLRRYRLKKAADLKKDQSYFLYRLTQPQLAQTLFPLGDLTKAQVKSMAAEAGFSGLADKAESQDFIDRSDYEKIFPAKEAKPGRILDEQGRQLGSHTGIHHFTVGQRHGLKIGGSGQPLYVLRIDAVLNDVIAGPRQSLAVQQLTAIRLNWIAFDGLEQPIKARARLRSRQAEAACEILPMGTDLIEVRFEQPQYSAAPGQSVVLYQEDAVLGGGIIQKVNRV